MHSQSLSGDGRLEGVSHSEVSREVLGIFRSITSRYWGWVVVLSILTGLGVASMIIRLTDGFDDRSDWGAGRGKVHAYRSSHRNPPLAGP